MANILPKCICSALHPKDKVADSRVCDFIYLVTVFKSDLSDHAKFTFCKYFSDSGFRHGWLISFRRAVISDEEYLSLKTLAERKFIELRDEGNGFIAIGRPFWPELYGQTDATELMTIPDSSVASKNDAC